MHKTHRRRNFAALIGDFALFSIGFAFYDPFVLVPAFVKSLTGSELMIGLLAGLRVLMVSIPQVWAASVLNARPKKKPFLVVSSIGGRLPVIVLTIVTLLWADRMPWLVIAFLAISVVFFFCSEGLNGVTWPALVGKVIPDAIRGRFLGLGQLLSSLGALGAGYVVRMILPEQGQADARQWAVVFTCASVGLMLSVWSMAYVREEPEEHLTAQVSVKRSVRSIVDSLRSDGRLRLLVVTQLVSGTAAATFPFFVVRAREVLPGGDQVLGLFLIAQNLGGILAALICGQLIDRVGSWASIRLVSVAQACALAAVLVAGLATFDWLYFVAFLLLGFVGGSSWWSFSSYLLDMATDEQRPVYLAASGILTSPLSLSSILVGGLFEVIAPEWIFALALGVGCVGLGLAWAMPRIRHVKEPASRAALAD
jgi:MFS family permease